jgi:putative thymidine phosphorylase
MKLKVRILNFSAGRSVVILNSLTAELIGIHVSERITLRKNHRKEKYIAIVDTTGTGFIRENEIAVSTELALEMGLKSREKVDVDIAPFPESLSLIKKKMEGHELSDKEIDIIINDIVKNAISEPTIAYFIASLYKSGMSIDEIIYMIKSFSKTGDNLKWGKGIIADKHSIGGVPGNRTTPLVVSICASAGLTIPKNSSRAITSAAGTADVIETIAKVDFSVSEIKEIIRKTNACLIWGGSSGLVPADSKIIAVEKTLKLDIDSLLIASIISKKIAGGSTHILIDIPYGKHAKVDKKRAIILKHKFEEIGRRINRKIKCVLTDGRSPIGNGIGPVLELMDVISVLKGERKPKDLESKSLYLAGELLEMTGKAKKGEGRKLATEILFSGRALKKFEEIIRAQGGEINSLPQPKYSQTIHSNASGKVVEIDSSHISTLARICGCPADKSSGIYLHYKVGERLRKGQPLLTLFSDSSSRLKEAMIYYHKYSPIKMK